MTPYFAQDGVTLYHGDNVQTMRESIPDASIDLVVTSPPYDNLRSYGGHTWDFEGLAAELWRTIKPGGVVVWVVADATIDGSETGTSFRQALRFMEIGFRLLDTMIYQKASVGGARGSVNAYWQAFEFMFVLTKDAPKTFNPIEDRKNAKGGLVVTTGGRRSVDGTTTKNVPMLMAENGRRLNVWRISTAEVGGGHPAPFPEALARDHILSWSNEGDIVLDPFSGSGTTAKMAKLMGRKGIGIEIHQDYCDIAVERLRQKLLF